MKKMIFVAVLLTITQQAQASAVIVASAAATTAATAAAANSANIANQQAQRAANASASALPISVKGSKQNLGFITCGKRSSEAVGSLGCTVYGDGESREIPWKTWPGYVLGSKLPASYEVNAVSFDHYNGVATVYFTY
ncbi:hypothetical protein AB4H00_004809 [Escherichia coli]|uniref:Prophage exported protein n=2 Tax=Escherichia coli TaxID=562 RepID=A0AAN3V4Y2_ECOLX|nr:hypothetical protein [Escherichia coli]EFN8418843.1 hypothetical protein [Escherichia coli O145]ELX0599246.1 hypothetical protein [Salmonella enterica subsp. enterica serovar Infantis]MED8760278.1 hypothetical protein [Escherichia marmotae]EFA6147319.1 hypothetical protein [Escherichia coli]EII34794.1 hypothetical protein EC40967_2937 [Escherichia coli 4.0967]